MLRPPPTPATAGPFVTSTTDFVTGRGISLERAGMVGRGDLPPGAYRVTDARVKAVTPAFQTAVIERGEGVPSDVPLFVAPAIAPTIMAADAADTPFYRRPVVLLGIAGLALWFFGKK